MKFFVVRYGRYYRGHFTVHAQRPTPERIEELRKTIGAPRKDTRPRVQEWEVDNENGWTIVRSPKGQYEAFHRGRRVRVPYIRFGEPEYGLVPVGVLLVPGSDCGKYAHRALMLMMEKPGIVEFIEEAPKKRIPAHGTRHHFVRGPRYSIVAEKVTNCD